MELDNPLESFLLHLEAKKQQKNMKVITIVNNGHATCQKQPQEVSKDGNLIR